MSFRKYRLYLYIVFIYACTCVYVFECVDNIRGTGLHPTRDFSIFIAWNVSIAFLFSRALISHFETYRIRSRTYTYYTHAQSFRAEMDRKCSSVHDCTIGYHSPNQFLDSSVYIIRHFSFLRGSVRPLLDYHLIRRRRRVHHESEIKRRKRERKKERKRKRKRK